MRMKNRRWKFYVYKVQLKTIIWDTTYQLHVSKHHGQMKDKTIKNKIIKNIKQFEEEDDCKMTND